MDSNDINSGVEYDHHEIHIWTERERRKKMKTMFSSLQALLPRISSKADKSTIIDETMRYIKNLEQVLENLHKQKLEKPRNNDTNSNNSTKNLSLEPSMITSKLHPSMVSSEAFITNHIQEESSNINYSMCTSENNYGSSSQPNFLTPHYSSIGFETWFSSNVVVNMCGNNAHISICTLKKPGLMVTLFHILEKHNLEVLSAHISSDSTNTMYMIHAQANIGYDELMAGVSASERFKLAAGEMNLCLFTY